MEQLDTWPTYVVRVAGGPGDLYLGQLADALGGLAPFVPVALRDAYVWTGAPARECAGRVAAVWPGASVVGEAEAALTAMSREAEALGLYGGQS